MSYPHDPRRRYRDSGGGSGSPGGALAAGILMTLCCNTVCGILAIVFAAMAMNATPEDQDRYVHYAWNSIIVGVIVTVVLLLLYLMLGGFTSTL